MKRALMIPGQHRTLQTSAVSFSAGLIIDMSKEFFTHVTVKDSSRDRKRLCDFL